jgi:type VI secretion system secreted protein Hcp
MARRSRSIALLLAIVLAAAAGYALAPRSRPAPAVSAAELAAQLQYAHSKPGDPIFMKITGIPGDSTVAGHLNWITLDSWDFGMALGDGSPSFGLMTVKAPASRANPPLMSAIAHDTLLPTVTLQASTVTPRLSMNFLTITLSQVTVESFQDTSTGGRPTDTIKLRFNKIDYKYNSGGKNYDFCWDINILKDCSV